MGLTICTFSGALRLARRWLGGADAPARHASSGERPHLRSHAAPGLHTGACRAHVAWPQRDRAGASRRPLRVLRVVDAGHAPCSAGRMVISGRMADVCAELDRLVALEAAAA